MGAPLNNKYAEGNDGGRPTKFTDDLLERASEYLKSCKDTIDENGRAIVNIPSVAGLAIWLKVSRETIYAWKKENKEFSDTIENLMALQEKALTDNGLSGRYNSTITKLILSKHGYSDKVETDVTSGGEKISVNVLSFDAFNNDTPQIQA